MRRRVLTICGLVLAAPAIGQVYTGSRLSGNRPPGLAMEGQAEASTMTTPTGVKVLRAFADCMIQTHRARSVALIEAAPAAAQTMARGPAKGAMAACLSADHDFAAAEMTAPIRQIQQALADAYLRAVPTAVPVAEPARPSYTDAWVSNNVDQGVIDRMAVCLASIHPTEVAALVTSTPGTPAEVAGFKAVIPYAGQCLVKDATLKSNVLGIRLALAVAYYHRVAAVAQAAPPAAVGKN